MSDANQILIGIDAGLTNVTVTAFDDAGTELASASRATPTVKTVSGRDEQDHERLWDIVCEATAAVVERQRVLCDDIASVGVAGHGHGLYGLDADGTPVCGIKSTDSRAIDILGDTHPDVYDSVVERLDWEPFGADPLSLLVWLRDNDPMTYNRLDTVLFSKDVLTYRLTGERSTDPSEASVFYGPDAEYDEQVFEALGLSEMFEALPPVVPSTDRCGRVTATAADRTGLPEGVPVATGLHDVAACTLGAGIVTAGDGLIILGTWGQSVAVLDDPDDGDSGLPRRYLDGWLRYKGIRSGAACVEWFVENWGAEWRRTADERGVSPYVVYEEAVDSIPPSSDGLLFHPFLKGSTDNPNSAGGFYGLRLEHTSAHLLRSIYEGVTVTQVHALDSITTATDAIRLTGGGARSEAWSQIFADVARLPVRVPSERETGALGAALCGSVAAGVYPTAEAAVDRTVGTAGRYDPNPETETQYRMLTDAFEQATDAMERPWETLKSLGQKR
ncbi:FGGY-family carbohydrate kinase [Halalkalicoccus jeotgali]|uniref:L-xylulose kinase protein n=1 Tax=Halalkalicoccus jeotgali (strain DSM 18796 / CECT 7217 / JCM 14584 / KCTC 4019 / B3) TaxID=795797 RepID=D8JB76_HALJB|nr:FGGY-family carbohydrate kinase [Halalkalicoccus jeotgali]ADJ16529.1 L-xylulose kinase protein [Halalkalicoccus jeotgali B3]ELY41376.1 L-xylulose kinase protein [Halalkalicoccus jeotgali B3]